MAFADTKNDYYESEFLCSSPRKNLVYELIRNDIFTIENTEKFDFLISLLDYNNQSLKHAITSLVSVISSTLRGVEYLTLDGKNNIVIEKIIKVILLMLWVFL